MTCDQILKHAMLELDEDLGDLNEYVERFMMYLNMGYQIILRQYYKPRETYDCHADENGYVTLNGYDVENIVEMWDKTRHISIWFEACADNCGAYQTAARNCDLSVVCQVNYPALVNGTDKPRIPDHVHYALVSYICYKHLSSGNLAKQTRAQYYLQSFYDAMRMIKPAGSGSVTTYRNLYSATDI